MFVVDYVCRCNKVPEIFLKTSMERLLKGSVGKT